VRPALRLLQLLPDTRDGARYKLVDFELPQIGQQEWFRLADTAQNSPNDIAEDGQEFPLLSQDSYMVQARSVAIFVAK
jgi:hypothetical protein